MSTIQEFRLGPYAEYLFRPTQHDDVFEELLDLTSEALYNNWGVAHPPEVTRDGVVFYRLCFVSSGKKPGEPARRFSFQNGVCGWPIEDLRGIDTQAEIDWFTRSFGNELARMTASLGREPTIHWGIVGWLD
jgi:hypothetical protein